MQEVIAQRKKAERQERAEQILRAGKKLFLEKAYWGTTIRDIALEAALSTGAVYFYFKSKDEIFAKICEEAFQVLLESLDKAARQNGTPLKKFEAVTKAYLKFYTDYPEYFRILEHGFKNLNLPPETSRKLDRLYFQAISILKEIIEAGIKKGYFSSNGDSWELTVTFWASIEGLLYLHKVGYLEKLNLEDLVQKQIQIFAQGTQIEAKKTNLRR